MAKLQATDVMQGRLPGSVGSARAQTYIINEVSKYASGVFAGQGEQAFKQAYGSGTNLYAVRQGTDLPNEYIVLGAHYDHLGSNCYSADSADSICNGATDNATGVAAVLDVLRRMDDDGFTGRRSIIAAFWDEEERGYLGSAYALNNLPIAQSQIKAYVNLDILGLNLLPSLRSNTFVIAAESGGNVLEQAVNTARNESGLDLPRLSAAASSLSDHRNFLQAGIPAVFFTDAIGGCYHTAQDDIFVVDFDKLEAQIDVISSLVRSLLNQSSTPQFSGAGELNYQDAQQLDTVFRRASSNRSLIASGWRDEFDLAIGAVSDVVNEGDAAFNSTSQSRLAVATNDFLGALRSSECDGHLPPETP